MCNLINTYIHTYIHTYTANTTYTICTYGHTYSKSMDQPGKVANPARGQLGKEN